MKSPNEINQHENVSGAYQQFCDFIRNEMDKHIEWSVPSIKNRPKKSRYKPYWNDDLQEQWSVVRAAELEWLRCDPNCFMKRRLKERYCLERRNFDRMNRRFKRQFQISKQNELSDLCVNNSESRNFWKYIGKLGIGNDRRNMIPWEIIEDDEVVSDKERVLRKWRQDYERLFRENGDNSFDDEHLNNVRSILNDGSDNALLANGTECSQLNYPITRNEVIDAVCAAKTRKAVGVDEIPAEELKNDICVDILFKFISACFELGDIPSVWKTGIISPIPKSSENDRRDPMSYRGLSLLSIPCKIYIAILNARLCKWLEVNDKLADEQNGFHRKRSCQDHLYALYSLVNNRKLARKSTYGCFVDAKKAFDTVNRDLLWYKLQRIGVNGKILSALVSLYRDTTSKVRVNDLYTDEFPVLSGVKQGCNLSPTLFAVYINDLAEEIKASGIGVHYDDDVIGILLYADDVVLLAESEKDLQTLLDILDRWCRRWRLLVNCDKTKIVHFRPPSIQHSRSEFTCGDLTISFTDKYKYLGLWFNKHLNMQFAVSELVKSASRALGALHAKFSYAGGTSFEVYDKLYKALVQPVMYYGSAI